MPRPRYFKLDEAKRNKIIEVSAKEFAENGFEKASYNKIMERLEISKGAMYYYFDDKSDLYRTVMQKMYEPCHELLWKFEIDTTSSDTFWCSLEALYIKNLENLSKSEYALPLYKHLINSKYDKHSCDVLKEMIIDLRSWCHRLLSLGQKHGIVRTDVPLDLLVMIYLGVGEAVDTWAFSNENTDFCKNSPDGPLDVFKKLIDLFKRVTVP